MKHYVKVPRIEAAIEAGQAILKAKGAIHTQTPRQIANSHYYPGASVIYGYIESGKTGGFWLTADQSINVPGPGDTLTDLTPLFKESEIEDVLESTGSGLMLAQSFKVHVTKEATLVGCQTFKNSDILRIADLVRKASR